MSNTPDLRARLVCLASLLQQLNAQNACTAVNDAIDAIQSPVCRDWSAWLESQSDDDLREIFAFRPDLSERVQAVITANAVTSGIFQSQRQVPEVDGNANISYVLCASFGQYFDAGGIIELDIQDDDQVRPLIAYMAQGIADHFLRDGNKLANLLYSMGEAVQASEWEQVQRELDELRATESAIAALLPGPYYMDPPDGGSVSLVEQLQRMADDARKWREANPAPPTSGPETLACKKCREPWPDYLLTQGGCIKCRKGEPTPAQAGAELPELPAQLLDILSDFDVESVTYNQALCLIYEYARQVRRGGSDA